LQEETSSITGVLVVLVLVALIIASIIGTLIYYKVQKKTFQPILSDAEDKMKRTLVKIDLIGNEEYK
jgi:uncharacterized protein YneF (UPF0154 family)